MPAHADLRVALLPGKRALSNSCVAVSIVCFLVRCFNYLSRPRTSCAIGILKTRQIRSKVRTVIGLPASICCQWRAEKPNEIMSS